MPIWDGNCWSFFRPSGTWFLFCELTQDLRPGLLYTAPSGLGFAGAFCLFISGMQKLLSARCDICHILPVMIGITLD